jgi:hypothetical protein
MTTDNEDLETDQRTKFKGLAAAFLVVLSFTVVAVLVAVVYLMWENHQRGERDEQLQEDIQQQAVENGALSERVLDCTEPGGECFEDGRQRTADAVMGINEGTFRVIVAALSCQEDGITEQRALARCTARRASPE